jgi:hypothetical protein
MATQPTVPSPIPQPAGQKPPLAPLPHAGTVPPVPAPGKFTKGKPLPTGATPLPAAPLPGAPTDGALPEGENPANAVPLGFFQRPWVQDVLPFVTSLMLHATVIIVAILTVKAIQIIKAPPAQEQVIIPDSNMVENGPPGGVPNVGLGDNPFKQAQQDKTPDGGTKSGFAEKAGPSVSIESAGGGSGDSSDSVIAVGPGGGFGRGQGLGSGNGGAAGSGNGDGTGALAAFGTPGGGGIGPQGPVFGHGGNARTIIFVCDCTGSMINKIAQLKIELSKAVQNLKPIQSFNIIFYQDEKVLKLNEGAMIPANSENKRKAETWLGDIVTAGTTDPVPALAAALSAKPQLMYFLTDAADFPDVPAVQNIFRKLNADHKTKVNTILFVESKEEQEANKESEPLMRGISGENGGFFKWVRLDQLN